MTLKKKSFGLDEIVSIENIGEIDTYDFSIPKTHCFFANGILVHNTGALEEVSDVCLLLHWNYFYTKKEEQKNLYDIQIAKNRHGRTGIHKVLFKPEFSRFEEMEVEIEEYEK